MKESKVFVYVGFVSGLVTIADCIINTINATYFTFSLISIVGLVVCFLAILIHLVLKDDVILYNLKKNLSYYTRNTDSYMVESKECVYTYKSRTEMEYTKNHDIISNVNNLKHFCDKFKWSKEQNVNEIDIQSNYTGHKIFPIKRIENWHQYTVEFAELGKGQKESISITIRNLHDPKKEAVPFLSSNVTCKTNKLRLVVIFKDDNLKPINIKYKIFDNYASDFPLFQEDLSYNQAEQKIERIEQKPIYGYRYEISWDFDE